MFLRKWSVWNTRIGNKWKSILLLFVALNTADLLLTAYGLEMGAVELNPFAQPRSLAYAIMKILLGPLYAISWYVTAIVARKCELENEKAAYIAFGILKAVLLTTVIVYIGVVVNNIIIIFKVLS